MPDPTPKRYNYRFTSVTNPADTWQLEATKVEVEQPSQRVIAYDGEDVVGSYVNVNFTRLAPAS